MKILNLYAGIGGNRKLWGEGHEITAVEYKPEIAAIYKDFFPSDNVIVADAHQYLLEHFEEYDFVWSSPPCPTHSRVGRLRAFNKQHEATGQYSSPRYPDMNLYAEVLFLKGYFKGKWCVENVVSWYEPLIRPQQIGRHWYWSNFVIPPFAIDADKIAEGKRSDWEMRTGFDLSPYKGIDKRVALRNCVTPEIGKHILDWAERPWEPNLRLAI